MQCRPRRRPRPPNPGLCRPSPPPPNPCWGLYTESPQKPPPSPGPDTLRELPRLSFPLCSQIFRKCLFCTNHGVGCQGYKRQMGSSPGGAQRLCSNPEQASTLSMDIETQETVGLGKPHSQTCSC